MKTKEQRKLWKADKQARLEAALLSGDRWTPTQAPYVSVWTPIKIVKPAIKLKPVAKSGSGVGKGLPKHERRIARNKGKYRAKVFIHKITDLRDGSVREEHYLNGKLVYDSNADAVSDVPTAAVSDIHV